MEDRTSKIVQVSAVDAKAAEMPVWAIFLFTELHSLKHKNLMLELRMKRMESRFRQVLRYTPFTKEHEHLAWGDAMEGLEASLYIWYLYKESSRKI